MERGTPTFPGPGCQGRACAAGPKPAARPEPRPGEQGRASPSRFIHSESGAASPVRSRLGREGDPRPRSRVPQRPQTRVRALPRVPRARGLRPGVVWETEEARAQDQSPATPPSTRAQARRPPLARGRFEALGPRHRAAPPRPEVAPAPPPHARLPSPPRPDPPSAASGLLAQVAGRRRRGAAPPDPLSRQEQSGQPEAGPGGYLDDPAGQPGHLVRSRLRPLVSSPAPLASRTSGSPGLHFRGRRRARRRRRGPLGNVVPARSPLASFGLGPLPGPRHPSPGL